MNTDHDSARPNPELQPSNPDGKAPPVSPEERRQALQKEIQALAESGSDPARLRKLISEWKKGRVQVINQLLDREDEGDIALIIEWRSRAMDMDEQLAAALDRPDVTFPEMQQIAKMHRLNRRLFRNCLLTEKRFLEPKTRPGQRGKRGCSPDGADG